MTKYTVSLPYVDEHEQGEEFVNEILKLSKGTNEDGRPVFFTQNLTEAISVIHEACEICRRHFRTIEFEIGIDAYGKDNAKGCQV
jgi:hypothetical protein